MRLLQQGPITLDGCLSCQFRWFDAGDPTGPGARSRYGAAIRGATPQPRKPSGDRLDSTYLPKTMNTIAMIFWPILLTALVCWAHSRALGLTRGGLNPIRRRHHTPSGLVLRLQAEGLLPVAGVLEHLRHHGPQGLHAELAHRQHPAGSASR